MAESLSALIARIGREHEAQREKARREQRDARLPWRDRCRANGWRFLCPACGVEVGCGWDDGFGLPDGTDPWRGEATIEGECGGCGAVSEVRITWVFAFDTEAPRPARAAR